MVTYKIRSTGTSTAASYTWGMSNDEYVTATIKSFCKWGQTDSTFSACSRTVTNKYTWPSLSSSCSNINFEDWYVPTLIPAPKPGEKLRKIIQNRQSPMIFASRKPVLTPQDEREIRARETLLKVIGAEKFQKFLKDGFVSVRAKSGLVYQIFPGHGVTAVYKDGCQIERLCVVLKGEFPPTDSLIMRYLIILNDESKFRSYAIKHQVIIKKPQIIADERSLTEIFRELKKVA